MFQLPKAHARAPLSTGLGHATGRPGMTSGKTEESKLFLSTRPFIAVQACAVPVIFRLSVAGARTFPLKEIVIKT